MRGEPLRLAALVGTCLLGIGVSAGWAQVAQTSKSIETKAFEVVEVTGNKLIAKTADGAKEYTVPEDFRFTVNGQQMSVHELKPGMKGVATITTITTTRPVTVTEVKRGTVMQASGNSIVVKSDAGIKMFTQGDLDQRNVTIMRDGQEVALSALHSGDMLTATIVTALPPEVMTQRQVDAIINQTPGAKSTGAAGASATEKGATATAKSANSPSSKTGAAMKNSSTASPSATTSGSTAGGGTGAKKTLPKTASMTPLVGLLGMIGLALAATLTTLRRRLA
jgi:hypothetical protein